MPDCACTRGIPQTRFNGIPIHALDTGLLIETVESMRACGRTHVLHFLACDPVATARRDPSLAACLCTADLNIPDGLPLTWAIRAAGGHATRITATDGLHLLADAGLDTNLGHYFYGSAPTTLARLTTNLKTTRPTLQIVGTHSPPYRPLTDDELAHDATRMRENATDILWLGLGAPKQNLLAERLRPHHPAPLIITIGAAFDFVAGTKRRAPLWMQNSGLEWLHRMLQEPRRLGPRYVVGNSRFILDAVRQTVSTRVPRLA